MRLPVGPHPRSRGENWMSTPPVFSFAGSSPLTRGKPDLPAHDSHRSGLIPAHAGKTSSFYAMLAPCRDHPRSRGENNRRRVVAWARPGSSPLTRGKLVCWSVLPTIAGLIPAHAGKTSPALQPPGPLTAHPRSHGENDDQRRMVEHLAGSSPLTRENKPPLTAFQMPPGSSPLTRAKRHACSARPVRDRLIPTHTGKTLRAIRRVSM